METELPSIVRTCWWDSGHITRDANTYQEKCVGCYCPSFLTLTSLFCHMSISIFLAYVYSLTTCLMLFHKTVPPSKGRWWYTFFLVLPCLCPFPILYKWVESLECSCTWQPELENDVYVGYIWRIYTMYVLGARYQARTSRVFISRSSPGFTSCYGQMRNSNKLGTQMSVWRILLFHMGLRLSMVKRSIPWTCMERIQLIWNVRSTFNLCPWLWWFEWECPPPTGWCV